MNVSDTQSPISLWMCARCQSSSHSSPFLSFSFLHLFSPFLSLLSSPFISFGSGGQTPVEQTPIHVLVQSRKGEIQRNGRFYPETYRFAIKHNAIKKSPQRKPEFAPNHIFKEKNYKEKLEMLFAVITSVEC